MLMTETADGSQIAKLGSSAMPSLAPVRCDGVFVASRGWLEAAGPCLRHSVRARVEKQLRVLHGQDGVLEVTGEPWAWAIPMRSFDGAFGHVIVAGEGPVPESEQFLLRVLAQQIGIAIANADSHARERAVAEELEIVNKRLERSLAIHRRLTEAAVEGGGMDGIADTVYNLTGYPVVIEDSRGKVLASAGPDTGGSEELTPDRREEILKLAASPLAPIRFGDRLASASGVDRETFAVIALIDPSGTAGDEERMALEQGSTVLAIELSRLQSILETESRLGRDLLEELLAGTDDERAGNRTRILGYDLGLQQRVAVINHPSDIPEERMFHAVRRAAQTLQAHPLLGSRRDTVVVLADHSLAWHRFRAAIDAELGQAGCRIGIGGICNHASDVPRSYREAQLAFQVMSHADSRASAVSFDDLGVFQILAETQDLNTIQRFVRKWIGALLDYDDRRQAELVATLSTYLEAGGNFADSARRLSVHRNTLRYRLRRIGEISGHNLDDPDVHFNLQVATRAWQTLAAMQRLDAAQTAGLGILRDTPDMGSASDITERAATSLSHASLESTER
jgi:DNA-binding PucR family transcriptional regulator